MDLYFLTTDPTARPIAEGYGYGSDIAIASHSSRLTIFSPRVSEKQDAVPFSNSKYP
jgi:hypothetical protein